MSCSESYPLLTLIFQGQLQIQRMSSRPASAAWHHCWGLSKSQGSAQLQLHNLPLRNLPLPSERRAPGQGRTQAALFSSLFAFSVTPGMCLHMVEKMQRAGRGGQERHPPCHPPCLRSAAGPAGAVAHASIDTQGSRRSP